MALLALGLVGSIAYAGDLAIGAEGAVTERVPEIFKGPQGSADAARARDLGLPEGYDPASVRRLHRTDLGNEIYGALRTDSDELCVLAVVRKLGDAAVEADLGLDAQAIRGGSCASADEFTDRGVAIVVSVSPLLSLRGVMIPDGYSDSASDQFMTPHQNLIVFSSKDGEVARPSTATLEPDANVSDDLSPIVVTVMPGNPMPDEE